MKSLAEKWATNGYKLRKKAMKSHARLKPNSDDQEIYKCYELIGEAKGYLDCSAEIAKFHYLKFTPNQINLLLDLLDSFESCLEISGVESTGAYKDVYKFSQILTKKINKEK